MSYLVKCLNSSKNDEYQMIGARVYSAAKASLNHFPSALLFQSKAKMFHSKTKHRVTFVQEITPKDDVRFKLWEGNEYSQSKEAFHKIEATLAPLLNSGSVLLTKNLLREIILPYPKEPEKICSHLIDVMEKGSDAYPEWLDVIEALLNRSDAPSLEPSSKRDYIANLREKFDSKKHSSVVNLMAAVPFVAMPNVATYSAEDEHESDVVWTRLRTGTLFKPGTQRFDTQHVNKDEVNTWLIDSIEKDHHKSCLNLILSRVNTNDKHPLTSDTALHVAVRKGNLTLVKLLLAYQADPTITNTKGETPLDIGNQLTCRSAGDIVSALEKMKELQMKAKSYYSHNNELPQKRNSSDTFLLSLDGGGMRSVITCHTLAAIEGRMKELCSSCQPLHSYFDYVAGTSSGAIIGAFLLYKSSISVSNAGMHMYKFMNEVFSCSKSNRSDKLKEFITDVVGKTTVMSDLPEGNMIITATIANTCPSKLHLMTNYGERRDGLLGPDERKLWEALIASSAAPTYFPSFDCFLDGGLMANNPTLPAMADIFDHSKKEGNRVSIGLVLSLGTGYLQAEKYHADYEVYIPGFSTDIIKTLFHSSMGLVRLLHHFIKQSTQSNGEVVCQAQSWCDSIGAVYCRLSPPLEQDTAPDMHSIEELIDLLFETEIYVLQEFLNIDSIAKSLLSK